MSYLPPPLARPPEYFSKHHGPRVGDILLIALVVAMVGFVVAICVTAAGQG